MLFADKPVFEPYHSVEFLRYLSIVRGNDERRSVFFDCREKYVGYLISRFSVQRARWLVCYDEFGRLNDRARDRYSLLMTAREFSDFFIRVLIISL